MAKSSNDEFPTLNDSPTAIWRTHGSYLIYQFNISKLFSSFLCVFVFFGDARALREHTHTYINWYFYFWQGMWRIHLLFLSFFFQYDFWNDIAEDQRDRDFSRVFHFDRFLNDFRMIFFCVGVLLFTCFLFNFAIWWIDFSFEIHIIYVHIIRIYYFLWTYLFRNSQFSAS